MQILHHLIIYKGLEHPQESRASPGTTPQVPRDDWT